MLKVLILLIPMVLLGCSEDITKSQGYIQRQIDQANYCETADDCADAGGKCPFGCYVYVNKEEVDRISDLIDSYESDCVYDCVMCLDVKCFEGKCEQICS